MRLWFIEEPSAGSAMPVGMLANIIRVIGTPDLASEVLAWINSRLCVDHCSLVELDHHRLVGSVAASARPSSAALTAHELYRRTYHWHDRIRNSLPGRRRSKHASWHVSLLHQKSSDIAHEDYRRLCYQAVGIGERLSIFGRDDTGHVMAAHFYRQWQSATFSAGDLAAVAERAHLLIELIAKHFEVCRLTADGPERYRQMLSVFDLPKRELDVCSRIVAGFTAKEIARDLGVGESTVVTYRRRAYERMNIKNARELAALTVDSRDRALMSPSKGDAAPQFVRQYREMPSRNVRRAPPN